ncbi:unnamed protein product [Bursaphelenchus xylophilus]|uniref:(pine wood nematode) hypothetical protein n=1 Tax=Bursaphelenchus xylophilus TaxID=6326 RepID=A0A1I7RRH8_BURXY|nr:unnamed protein product [Bursaphelenchus xylophilus]CAG9131048.1 unnamed protein product [Bursaphelenchus xylophilus]
MSAVEAELAPTPQPEEEVEDGSESVESPEAIIPVTSVLNQAFPLKDVWSFWYLDNRKSLDWLERLHNICKIDSVESFWALMDHIRPPAVMFHCDYSLFRDDIQPVWEVDENREGGRLVLLIQKSEMEYLNELWEKLLVALIGNRFREHTSSVCGAVCNIRQKGSKITLWTSKASDVESNKAIGGILREVWEESHPRFIEKRRIRYESHADAQSKQGSATPHKFEC